MDSTPTPTATEPTSTSPPTGRESLSLNDGQPSRPVRNDDYEEDIEVYGEDEGEWLKAEADGLDVPRPARPRSGSLHFDFGSGIMLASSQEVRSNRAPNEPIGLLAGVALIVGMQIGSGIFSSPGVVARETGSVGSALLLWVGAGMLAWAGASSFAELGTSLPVNGGAQAYLDAAFGPLPAYCFSFTAVTALRPGSQAIIATIFGEYLTRVLYHTAFSSDPEKAARGVPDIAIRLTGITALLAVGALQALSSKAGTRAQLVLTIFKVFALVLVFIGGLVFLGLGKAASEFSFSHSSDQATGYALALFSALWTYDGWDQANYVAKDVKPGKLPVMINSSMGLIVSLFVAANASYFIVLPYSTVIESSTIGLAFGRAIAGPVGGLLFALVVSVSCLGAMNGALFTSARLIVAAAEEGFLPSLFSRYHSTRETPLAAIALSTALSVVFIFFGDFAHLTLFYGFSAWTWNLAVGLGLLVLRVREPGLKRPYRTFLATPVIFACTALFLLILSAFSKPLESLAAACFCVAGAIPFYFQDRRRRMAQDAAVEMS